jgi:hypothetical protein
MQNLLKKTLPCRRKYSTARFLLKNTELDSLLPIILRTIEADANATSAPECVEIIKRDNRRFVFRVRCGGISLANSFIVKVFPFITLRHKISYYWKRHTQSRFGFGDASALLAAKSKGINTPQVYGYGYIKTLSVFPNTDMIIMQDLDDHTDIGSMLSVGTSDAQCKDVLKRTIPILSSLYRAGCNNIDLNSGAIMLGNTCDAGDYILDFEYAKFHDKPSLEILMSEMGTFARKCSLDISSDSVDWWFGEVLRTLGITENARKKQLRERFDYHHATVLSRKTRMKMK